MISLFKKKTKKFIPAYVGLTLIDPNKNGAADVCKMLFKVDDLTKLTQQERDHLNYIIAEVAKVVHDPPAPTGVRAYDLTVNALLAFEDYNVTAQQSTYLLACVYRSSAAAREKMAQEIYANWDFRDFWAKHIFFLTWRGWQQKRSSTTVKSALRRYRAQKIIIWFSNIWSKRRLKPQRQKIYI